jgi:hypothetical protein
MKIQTELPVFEVAQPFYPLHKQHYVIDRTFRLNARFFPMQKGKSEFFETERVYVRFRPWSVCPGGVLTPYFSVFCTPSTPQMYIENVLCHWGSQFQRWRKSRGEISNPLAANQGSLHTGRVSILLGMEEELLRWFFEL